MKSAFAHFDGAYSHSSEFPVEAAKKIPPSFLHAIDDGNEKFFCNLKPHLPRFYTELTQACGRVHLLEIKAKGISISDLGKEKRAYWWGLECKGRLITIQIPVIDDSPLRSELQMEYLAHLPVPLRCCYEKTDGMAVANGIGPDGFDLPSAFEIWRTLTEFCDVLEIPEQRSNRLAKNFLGSDVRVFIRGSREDLILVDLASTAPRMLHVPSLRSEIAGEIRDTTLMDEYFACAVNGFRRKPALDKVS